MKKKRAWIISRLSSSFTGRDKENSFTPENTTVNCETAGIVYKDIMCADL